MGSRRVYFAVFGSGLGHVTRTLEISNRLPPSEYVSRFSTSGQGFSYLEAGGKAGDTERSPPLDVEWSVGGGFSSHRVLPRFPFMFNAFLRQVAFEREAMERFRPSLVVSDSRLSPVFAARSRSYPVITMLNQFKVLFPPRFRGTVGRLYERIAGDALGLMWSLSDRVLVTDLPPPYTIGEANLSGSEVSRIVRFVGFTAPVARPPEGEVRKVKETLGLERGPLVFCQISGPDATKGRLVEMILSAAKGWTRRYDVVVSLGHTGGSTQPRRLANGAWLFEWCPIKDELLELATVVVARAGHSTIGQCIERARPAVLIPIHNHPEQIGNAEKFARLGLGIAIRSERLTEESLVESVDSCADDTSYRQRIEAVSAISKRYNGVERCAEIIRSLA